MASFKINLYALKKIFLPFLLIILFSKFGISQNIIKYNRIDFSYTKKTKQSTELLFDSLTSHYYNVFDEQSQSESSISITQDPQLLDTIHKKRFDTAHVIAIRHTLSGKRFCVKEDAISPKWKLFNNEQIILGYKCKLAKSTINGITYVAWYTLELNFPFGPNKLGGLPGIILELSDEKKEIFYLLAYEVKLTNDKLRNQPFQINCGQPILSKTFQEILQKEIIEHNSKVMDIINNGSIKQNNQF